MNLCASEGLVVPAQHVERSTIRSHTLPEPLKIKIRLIYYGSENYMNVIGDVRKMSV